MIFTKKQADEFVKQLRHKKTIQTAIEALIASMTKQLHLPVNIVNSGSKRLYEEFINTNTTNADSTITAQSIQVSLGDISLDSSDNVAPHNSAIILKASGIPHRFACTVMQRRLTCTLECVFVTSNSLEALEATEYIIDNLSNQQIFNYENLGVQHQGAYSLSTDSFDKDINKDFDYDNSPNGVNVSFSIEAEIMYSMLQVGKIISHFAARTYIDETTKRPMVDINNETGRFDDDSKHNDVGNNTGTTPMFESDNDIIKYVHTIKANRNGTQTKVRNFSKNVTQEDIDAINDELI